MRAVPVVDEQDAPETVIPDPEPVTRIKLTDTSAETTTLAEPDPEPLDVPDAPDLPEAEDPTTEDPTEDPDRSQTQDGTGENLEDVTSVEVEQTTLSSAPRVAADDLDQAIITPALSTADFYVAGVTWDPAGTDEPPYVFIRVLAADGWTEWDELDTDPLHDDATVVGTEPYVTGVASGVQVKVRGAQLPADLAVVLMPANPSTDVKEVQEPDAEVSTLPEPDEDRSTASTAARSGTPATTAAPALFTPASAPAAPGTTSVAAAAPVQASAAVPANAAMPTSDQVAGGIISRSAWGANEARSTWRPSYHQLRAAVVHHTAGNNNYTRAQSASIVRGIHNYHAVTLGWNDIGYNYLVDKYGQVFEGRRGTLASNDGVIVTGAHARSYNQHSLGISAIGNYTSTYAPQVILDRMSEVIGWHFARAGIDVTTASRMPNRTGLPRIFAHRDVGSTICPGQNIYNRLPTMRTSVGAVVDRLSHQGNRYLLRNDLRDGSAHIDFRYGRADDDVLVGDWYGQGRDTFTVRRGREYHVQRHLQGGQADHLFRYGRPDDEVVIGDWNGDGSATLAVRRGNHFHIRNSLTDGTADLVVKFGQANDEVVTGDWNGDGRDTLAVRRGNRFFFTNTLQTGEAEYTVQYGRADDLVLVGDWNGDGKDTLAIRRGREYHIKNSIEGGEADVRVIYGRLDDVSLTGDWNGDGKNTLGVRRR
ncbi:N-acetylmuramoyl-L-alanine amidase [Cellulomonas bogoriensis]|uniref:Peptidoglycan recognition protein family domain-containing protein n=1 Tax=Cellulomonas bogoriensis 69B4 = DSM 16987 TaxID=1386082 RepID=A0A0A0BQJ7_9CELL|nr:N-acetylmuramoyl-L-alanine amidase [Cellulomonas bogoriensis]KGM09947.1 hypothetical protein N869_05845 [Cellulomonas bogoriensis 69B4 = DSM 16987]